MNSRSVFYSRLLFMAALLHLAVFMPPVANSEEASACDLNSGRKTRRVLRFEKQKSRLAKTLERIDSMRINLENRRASNNIRQRRLNRITTRLERRSFRTETRIGRLNRRLERLCGSSFDATAAKQLQGVVLVNAGTGADIATITDGTQFLERDLPADPLNIVVRATGATDSVRFNLNGQRHLEVLPPYAAFGDNANGTYFGRNLAAGEYTLIAEAFDNNRGRGTPISTIQVSFTILANGNRPPSNPGQPSTPEFDTLSFGYIQQEGTAPSAVFSGNHQITKFGTNLNLVVNSSRNLGALNVAVNGPAGSVLNTQVAGGSNQVRIPQFAITPGVFQITAEEVTNGEVTASGTLTLTLLSNDGTPANPIPVTPDDSLDIFDPSTLRFQAFLDIEPGCNLQLPQAGAGAFVNPTSGNAGLKISIGNTTGLAGLDVFGAGGNLVRSFEGAPTGQFELYEFNTRDPGMAQLVQAGSFDILAKTVECPAGAYRGTLELQVPDLCAGDNVVPLVQQGNHNFGEALQKAILFFDANQMGAISPLNRFAWRQDSLLYEGENVGRDLSGGFADCGDHILFGKQHSTFLSILGLSAHVFREEINNTGQMQFLLGTIKHGTDWIMKAHEMAGGNTERFWAQLSNSSTDHTIMLPLEKLTHTRPVFDISASKPGSDLAGLTSAALSLSALAFDCDTAYAAQLIEHAKAMYEFGLNHRGYMHQHVDTVYDYQPNGDGDELAYAAISLYAATQEQRYLTEAQQLIASVPFIAEWTFGGDHAEQIVRLMLAAYGDDAASKDMIAEYVRNYRTVGAWGGQIRTLPPSNVLYHFPQGGGVFWGASGSWTIQALYAKFFDDDPELIPHLRRQLEFFLGDNSTGMSYMIGYGSNFPQRPHHRGAEIRNDGEKHTLWGAYIPGPTDNEFGFVDDPARVYNTEPCTGTNSHIIAPLALLRGLFGGDPLPDEELESLEGVTLERVRTGITAAPPAPAP